ncbi:MAG: hypothetical protein JST59_26095 [Actinobacteria bacterium]|nr:hypothetical protein [Actinomycetota bacterium]
MPKRLLPLAVAAVLLVFAVAGCGGGTSSSTTGAAAPDGGKPFLKYTKSKKIVAFGTEASAEEREAASAILAQNLVARQAADFAAQCSSLGNAGLEAVLGTIKSSLTAQPECAEALKKFAEPLKASKGVRTDTLSGSIAALRVEGHKAFALFHGNDGHGYAMPMELEDGEWRVGAIMLIPLR